MKSVYLQQTIIPDYRVLFFELLQGEWLDFRVYAGDSNFGGSPVSAPDLWNTYHHISNRYLLRGRFLWQPTLSKDFLSADVAILNANQRILSNYLILIVRRALRRKTLLWGHAEGRHRLARFFRGFFMRLSSGFIAYTESQSEYLRNCYPWLRTWVAPNACLSTSDCVPIVVRLDELDCVLYVGRLVSEKKVCLLLEAFIYAREHSLLSDEVRLVIVGEGAERAPLEQRIAAAKVEGSVVLAGHVSDVGELRRYYARSFCSVSPGYVGLSATQSFGFGVPMIVARDESHSPEIEACIDGFNATFFTSNDVQSLAQELARSYALREGTLAQRGEIARWTAEHYSFEAMRDTFVEAVKSC